MEIQIESYTRDRIPDMLDFEKRLREEENFWGWEIDEAYVDAVEESFDDRDFDQSVSLMAYWDGKAVGRIDAALIASRFDGSKKAYLDWICVIKSCRHMGVAQKLMEELKRRLKEQGVDTLVALTAANEEAQSFYQRIPDSEMHDVGIWINIK